MNERQRIQQVIVAEQMTAKQFAQEVGISAGTLSNILGGRNNPSLDVMQGVLNRFRTISSDWLILGVGSMYRKSGEIAQTLFDMRPEMKEDGINTIQSSELPGINVGNGQKNEEIKQKSVQKIIVFYTDGTFEER